MAIETFRSKDGKREAWFHDMRNVVGRDFLPFRGSLTITKCRHTKTTDFRVRTMTEARKMCRAFCAVESAYVG